MELTEWFDYTRKPDLVGVYETRTHTDGGSAMQHWNGEFWGVRQPSANGAEQGCEERSCFQQVDWRGLAQDPNAK